MTTAAPPSSGVQVRQAERGDLPAIYSIEQSVFPQPWPVAAFERYLGQPGLLVADDDGGVGYIVADDDGGVGYIVADTVPGNGYPICHVKDLAVSRARRREGIASNLLSRALGVLEHRVVQANLELRACHDAATELYRPHGFTSRRRRSRYYATTQDALAFVQSL